MMINAFDAPSRASLFLAVLFLIGPASFHDAAAQASVDIGGTAYVDYFYTVSSPDDEEEGFHGFTYRRLFLTTDFRLSEDFKGRARLEAHDGTTGPNGPIPFVKDLYLTWNYAGDHSATMGVAPPPVFAITEIVWGYRSLEKTVLDFQGLVGSRDFGIRFNGPLFANGKVRYAAMLANNSASKPETDKFKRGYVQLEFYPTDDLTFTAGADHAGFDEDAPVESTTRISGFAGYSADKFMIGVEPFMYYENTDFDDDSFAGVSVFGRVMLAPQWEVVARGDFVDKETKEAFVLGGIAYRPNRFVKIIPNIWIFDTAATDESHALARLTLDVSF